MTTALANVQYKPTEITTERLGQIMVKSGFFKDLRDEAQAIVKILYGRELGIGPLASVLGVYIVEGRPSLSAQLIASLIQRSKHYRYRVREWTATVCRIEFFEDGESLGESSFTIAEANTAGLANKAVWKQYTKAMLWARAMSQGARAYAADVFSGPIYTPDELGGFAEVDGRVVNTDTGEVVSEPAYVPTRERDPEPAEKMVTSCDDRLYKRYADLFDEAVELGLEPDTVEVPISVEHLTRMAIELKAAMVKAQAAQRQPEEAEVF